MRPRELGSPPHTRGKAPLRITLKANLRITPAYAGKSAFSFARQSFSRDHPRIRGEKLLPLQDLLHEVGSPPHTRGKDGYRVTKIVAPGITPAYAGKSLLWLVQVSHLWDHPRIRGEKNTPDIFCAWHLGSPPHTRGKDKWQFTKSAKLRITPAYAGKSFLFFTHSHIKGDHPRIRGEKTP